jgi:hypothetical protein
LTPRLSPRTLGFQDATPHVDRTVQLGMSLPDPALITGLAVVAVAGLAVALALTRRRPPEVVLTITRNALPPRDSSAALDASDAVAVRVGETRVPPVAMRIASGADPVLYRLLALDSPDDIEALESAPPPEHEDRVAALRTPRTGPVEWQQAGEVGRAGGPLFARAASNAAGDLAAGGSGDTEPTPADEKPPAVLAGVAVPAADSRANDGAGWAARATDGAGGGADPAGSANPADPADALRPVAGDPAGDASTTVAGGDPAQPPQPAVSSPAAGGAEEQPRRDGDGEETGTPAGAEACGAERHIVRELSALVIRARAVHGDALERQRRLQREHDAASARAEAAAHVMDRRRVLEEKEAAQRRFRFERTSAQDAAGVEEAASRWLSTINQLNVRVRDAQRVAAAERHRASRLVTEMENGAGRVDAARIALESAEHRVHEAREALAACEELHGARLAAATIASTIGSADEPSGVPGEASSGPAIVSAGAGSTAPPRMNGTAPGTLLGGGLDAAASQETRTSAPVTDDDLMVHGQIRPRSLLEAILEGDEDALAAAVVALAPDSIDDGRRWHLELSALRDALTWATIEAALVDLPRAHAFWSEFSAAEAREIAVALSSLGYRYDGRGGFAEGRIPSTRDLALAVGYAGVDPRRIRRWPGPAEIALLLDGARVAVAEFVLAGAPDLSLGQMVTLLGRRAPQFTALWDEWGRLRPILSDPVA